MEPMSLPEGSRELPPLVDDPAYRTDLDTLRSAMDDHLVATDDPFRHLRNDILMPADEYEPVMKQMWQRSAQGRRA